MAIWKEQYLELEKAALSAEATKEDINRLGKWFELYGESYWNGEYYNIDGDHRLYSIDEEDEDGDFRHIGWEVR